MHNVDSMSGWIKLHRKIKCHWVFQNADYFKAWISILIEVNHTEKTVLINSTLFNCSRGESLKSLDSWATIFGKKWDKSKVRRFFKLLEKDQMVVTKSERKTTRLTVCNYEDYQSLANADETIVKRKRNDSETLATPNKNEEKEKNVKKKTTKAIRPDNFSEKDWDDLVAHRKAKKAPLSQKAVDGLSREFAKSGMSISDCIGEMAIRGWTGFKAEWVSGNAAEKSEWA